MNKVYEVIIIGSGFSGIGTAVNLRKEGIDDFLILERDEELGGTWWRNSYPGAAVDVESQLYSFSFEPYNWTRLFAKQPELLEYTRHLLKKYRIAKQARTQAEVAELRWEEAAQHWLVKLTNGELLKATSIVNASGGLSQPMVPDFPGIDRFEGVSMHTGRWDHSYNYAGKRVAIIGTGASAVQTIPAIADRVGQLFVFQRTPHWIMPRPDRKLTALERGINERTAFFSKLYRSFVYWRSESRFIIFRYLPFIFKTIPQWQAKRNIRKGIKDPVMQQQVLPDYTMGCKRILISNEYYPALTRPNVELIDKTNGLSEITPKGIKTVNGREIEVDMLIYATGFKAAEDNLAYPVIGRDGQSMEALWGKSAHAYLGTTVPGFPNFYIVQGPNTGIGHTSALYMIESQLKYIVKALSLRSKNQWKSIEVKAASEERYNSWIKRAMKNTIWQTGGCKSWYQTAEGLNTTLYPGFTFLYRRACANFKLDDHQVQA